MTVDDESVDEKADDEEKVEDKIETELRRLVNDSHVDDIFYKSLLHPKQYSHGHNTTINNNIGSKWSCLLCSKLNGTYDKFCQTCLSKHEHALLEQEVIMFKLKHNKKKNDNGNAGKNTSGEDNHNKKLTSVGSRWRQFQQAEFHSRSRRSLTRRVGFNPDFDNINNSWRRSRRASFRPPPPPQLEVTPEQESQILQLHEMGFTNRNEALGALRANDFNLNGAVELLLASQFA